LIALPPGTAEVRLLSDAERPTRARPWVEDRRRLGAGIRRIRVDGEHILPLDSPSLRTGWWRPDSAALRWSDGDATLQLPPGSRLLELRLAERPVQANERMLKRLSSGGVSTTVIGTNLPGRLLSISPPTGGL